jgi:ribosomal protein S27E
MIGRGRSASPEAPLANMEQTPMKQVVVFDGLHEFAVRPRETFDKYIELLADDISRLFADRSQFVDVRCPACGSRDGAPAFTKLTFSYVACCACGSVFASPRPTPAALRRFMKASVAVRFWRSTLEAQTAHDRAQSIVHPRVAWIESNALDLDAPALIDLHSKYPRFLEVAAATGTFARVYSIEPALDRSELPAAPNLEVMAAVDDALAAGLRASVLSAQECLEREAEPDAMLRNAAALLADDGLLFLTTITSSGFDFQILGTRTKAVVPPTHLNVLSLEGIRRLLAHHHFAIVEFSTPGQLDVEIVAHAAADNPELVLPPFVDELIRHRGTEVHRAFQQFLQEARLSSHVRITARKKSVGEARDGDP